MFIGEQELFCSTVGYSWWYWKSFGFTQQITWLKILVLCVFREHSNQTLHSNHLLCQVCCFSNTAHTSDNKVGDNGAESISRALHSNTSLTSLDMSSVFFWSNTLHTIDNKIGYSGAEHISLALQSNTALKSLDVSCMLVCVNIFHTADNQIGDVGVARISLALQSNTALTSLDISGMFAFKQISHSRK